MFANDHFGSIEYKYHIISDMDKIINLKHDSLKQELSCFKPL